MHIIWIIFKKNPHAQSTTFTKSKKMSLLYSVRATCLFYAPFFLTFLQLWQLWLICSLGAEELCKTNSSPP